MSSPYDDKAAEDMIREGRTFSEGNEPTVEEFCDCLDSARAEIARLRQLCAEAAGVMKQGHHDSGRTCGDEERCPMDCWEHAEMAERLRKASGT